VLEAWGEGFGKEGTETKSLKERGRGKDENKEGNDTITIRKSLELLEGINRIAVGKLLDYAGCECSTPAVNDKVVKMDV
jgi:hypothetical protein